jgi:hypothetical protein
MMPDEFHEWRVEVGVSEGYCEMALCDRPRAYRAIYTYQQSGMSIPDVRTWAVCALHARAWAQEKGASVPAEGIAIAPEMIVRSLAGRD